MELRLIELFAGIGSQAKALERLGIPHEKYRIVEFDKYAVASYNAVHGTDFPVLDITKIKGEDLGIVDTTRFTYLLTYSFPCQDLSVAGKMRGMDKGGGTRSGLLWEVERLLNECTELPQYLLMENVPQVHGKQNIQNFNDWLAFLEGKGYKTFWQDLNAKDYGIPQSRKRCFAVSILNGKRFAFPKPIPLEYVMKDFLEPTVDEKFYLTSDKAKTLIDQLVLNGKIPIPNEPSQTEPLNQYEDATCRTIKSQYQNSSPQNFSRQNTFGASGCITLNKIVGGGNSQWI